MAIIGAAEFEQLLAEVRRVLAERSISAGPDTELHYLMDEVRKYVARTGDLASSATDAGTDERAVTVGYPLLCFWHLADAIACLHASSVPTVQQALETVSSRRHGDADQEEQFYDAAYELTSANDFLRCGIRPSFIHTKQCSRYQKRVEYLLMHKWPVECKRPRSLDNIVGRAKDAREKIDERKTRGLVCISLSHAFSDRATFREYQSVHHLQCCASEQLNTYLAGSREQLLAAGTSKYSIGVVFHLELLGYLHDTERVSGPLLRCAITAEGRVLSQDVLRVLRQMLRDPEAEHPHGN